MKTVIYKYPLETFRQDIKLPVNAFFLDAFCQDDNPMLWFRVDIGENLATERRLFRLVGTGHAFDNKDEMTYLKTFTQKGGALVWHLFEIKNDT